MKKATEGSGIHIHKQDMVIHMFDLSSIRILNEMILITTTPCISRRIYTQHLYIGMQRYIVSNKVCWSWEKRTDLLDGTSPLLKCRIPTYFFIHVPYAHASRIIIIYQGYILKLEELNQHEVT